MIFLDVNNEEYYDDIRVMTLSFFPESKVSVEKQDAEDARVAVKAEFADNIVKLWVADRHCEFETDFSDKKRTHDELKTRLYDMFGNLTGKTLPWGILTGVRPSKIVYSMLERQCSEEEIFRHMKEHYRVSDEKIHLALTVAKKEKSILDTLDYDNGYSLYIGIPFCPTTCLYCSFTSYPLSKWENQVDKYLDALIREMEAVSAEYVGKTLDTVYFGGGTPTTLTPEQLDRLLSALYRCFDMTRVKELTVEAGRPDSVTREKLMVLKKHHVTRISVNPQTMNQATLDLIGRKHTVEQVCQAFNMARECGFDNINMDLIVGLPGETIQEVENTMKEIEKLNPDSVTVHSLAIKRAAALKIWKEKYTDYEMVNNDEIMKLTHRYAAKIQQKPYYMYRQKNMAGNFENVGFAREGKEGIYNILIMEEKQTIVACGAGTITKRVFPDGRIERCDNVKDVALYIEKIDEMIERKRNLFAD